MLSRLYWIEGEGGANKARKLGGESQESCARRETLHGEKTGREEGHAEA